MTYNWNRYTDDGSMNNLHPMNTFIQFQSYAKGTSASQFIADKNGGWLKGEFAGQQGAIYVFNGANQWRDLGTVVYHYKWYNSAPAKSAVSSAKPAKIKITKITAGKKKMIVKWKKLAKSQNIIKYEISYRIKGKKWSKSKAVSKSKSVYTLKKLKKGKKYQARVRSYETADGKNVYSAWSSVKTSQKIK